jgi:uncharacterized protein (TIGR04141 family)
MNDKLQVSIFRIDVNNEKLKDFETSDIVDKIMSDYEDDQSIRKELDGHYEVKNYSMLKLKKDQVDEFKIRIYYHKRFSPCVWEDYLIDVVKDDRFMGLKNIGYDILVFVFNKEQVYALTSGTAHNVVTYYIDDKYPFNLLMRLVDSSGIMKTKSRFVTGSIYARDQIFRGKSRISSTEAFGVVWKELIAVLRKDVLLDKDFRHLLGDKELVNCDVKDSFRIRKKLSFENTLKLIEKLDDLRNRPLNILEKEAFEFITTMKQLGRKNKGLIQKLEKEIIKAAHRCLNENEPFEFDFCNIKIEQYLNANSYVFKGNKKLENIEEWYGVLTAKDILIKLKDVINDEDIHKFESNMDKVIIESCHDDPSDNTRGSIIEHLHGELNMNNDTYFLLDKKWYSVSKGYVDLIRSEFNTFVKNNSENFITSRQLPLNKWDSKIENEAKYNSSHAKMHSFIVGDKILVDNIEYFDILYYGDTDKLYLCQVKKGFAAEIREAASQLRSASRAIEQDIKGNKNRLKLLYSKLRFKKSKLSIQGFLELFMRRRIIYVLAFKTSHELNVKNLMHFKSNIARFEVLGLANDIRGQKTEFKLLQIL